MIRQAVDLPAPAAEVFRFIAATDNYPRFIPAYRRGSIVSGRDGEPGMTFRWRTRGLGLPLGVEETIVERAEGERIRYRGRIIGIPFESSMETTPAGASTSLAVTVRADLPGPFATRLLEAAVRRVVAGQVTATLDRLRTVFAPDRDAELGVVRDVYATWGRHPALYAAQDRITFAGRHRTIRRRAVVSLGLSAGARVLEVACGTGRNFEYLEQVIGPGGTLVGFDFSGDMLDAARRLLARRGWRNVELIQGDAAALEVGATPFDAVLCVLGMSAIPDHRRALERCHAVLRRGGRVVVCDGRPFSGRFAALNPAVRAIYRRWAAWNATRDLVGDLEAVFGNVAVTDFNLGTIFIATSIKGA